LLHGIAVTTAEVNDKNEALAMIIQHKDNLSEVKNILTDGRYTKESLANAVNKI
jgi:hypothetical protein